MEIVTAIQSYDWGKRGKNSLVAKLYGNVHPDFKIGDDAPFAELWMGTHPNGPARIRETNQPLSAYIAENPQCLGEEVRKVFGDELPFLFKVLSINKALSVQVHPSKKHAEELHAQRPDIYKDPNHKPEMAIALTKMEALCGFRPISEIKTFLKEIKELRNLVGEDVALKLLNASENSYKTELQSCFRHLMTCSEETVAKETQNLLKRFEPADSNSNKHLASLFKRLNADFSNDIGCFSIYFLNFITLQPLEAMYLGANEPHAYIFGDCIECMACSDNVVRAGLTPKYKDVETLCAMLNYRGEPAKNKLYQPVKEDSFCQLFKPPIPDFAVVKIEVPAKEGKYSVKPRSTASILLNVSGIAQVNQKEFIAGRTFFIPAGESVQIENISKDLLLFQALANV